LEQLRTLKTTTFDDSDGSTVNTKQITVLFSGKH
jgi:hypothetical protein